MAERRMFAKSVIGSGKFLRMPPTSRLLYYDLGMQADDDGVVEAFSVMRMTGATEDDLRVLVSKGFVSVLTDELVAYINDWKKNNFVRGDRYQPSIYKELILQLGIPSDNQTDTNGIPTVYQRDTQDRLGKDRLGKDRLGKDRLDKDNLAKPEPKYLYQMPLIGGKTYGITEDFIKEMQELYRAVNVDLEIRRMIGWCKGNSDKLKTSRGIMRFITNWLSKAQDKGGTANAEGRRTSGYTGGIIGTEI